MCLYVVGTCGRSGAPAVGLGLRAFPKTLREFHQSFWLGSRRRSTVAMAGRSVLMTPVRREERSVG